MNKKLIAPIASLVLLSSLSVGVTYALFTSNAHSDFSIQSGKVKIAMNVSNLKTYSGKWNSETSSYDLVETENKTFSNGGTAKIEGDVLSLDRISPMDKVEFDVSFVNDSNIDTKVRLVKEVILDDGLFEGLEVKFGNEIYDGMTDYGEWTVVEPSEDITGYHVSTYLPEFAGNEYQEKTCKIRFGIEAVQANAHVQSLPEDADLGIYNANDLMIYGRGVEAGKAKYTHKVAVLMNDIDMEGLEWKPVNVWSKGITFDGLNHTISNLKIKDGYHGSGFFTGGNQLLMKNVKFDKASVTGIGQVGIAVGNGDCARLENITVTNSSVKAVVTNNDDGDKAGAIVGYLCYDGGMAYLKNSKVEGCKVEGYRDVGGAVGIANGACVVENVDVKDSKIIVNKLNNYKGYTSDEQFDIHEVIGETTASANVVNTTFDNVTIEKIEPAEINDDGQVQLQNIPTGKDAYLPEGTMKLSNIGNDITIKGTRDEEGNIVSKIDAVGTGSVASIPNGSTFEDVAIEFGQGNYHGFQHAGTLVFKNCELSGLFFSYGDMIFENCTFTNTKESGEYNMWAYGNDLLFKNCTFNSYGKFINVYNEGAGEYTCTFEGCTFNNLGNTAKKAAINVKERCNAVALGNNTIIKNCTTTGAFPEASTSDTLIVFNSLVQVDDRFADDHSKGKVTVTYEDALIYANGMAL